jgi:hypothetical protein
MPFWTPLKIVVFFGAVILFVLIAEIIAIRRWGFSGRRDGLAGALVLIVFAVFVAPWLLIPSWRAGLIKNAKNASSRQAVVVIKPQPPK